MALFEYAARDRETGRQVTGTVDAPDRTAAVRQIEKMRLVPVRLEIRTANAPQRRSLRTLITVITCAIASILTLLAWLSIRPTRDSKAAPRTASAAVAPSRSIPRTGHSQFAPDVHRENPTPPAHPSSAVPVQQLGETITTQPTPTPSRLQKQRVVEGEIFVVTKARANIKLALVDILAIPTVDMTRRVQTKQFDIDNQSTVAKNELRQQEWAAESAQRDRDAAYEAVMAAREKQLNVLQQRNDLVSDVRGVDVSDTSAVNTWKRKADRLLEEDRALDQRIAKLETDLERAEAKLEDARAKKSPIEMKLALLASVAKIFESLPDPTGTCRTDSNGRFCLELPDHDPVTLVATTSRDVFGSTETYFWIVPLNRDQKAITLSNDNMIQ